jgi:hypothetical protein
VLIHTIPAVLAGGGRYLARGDTGYSRRADSASVGGTTSEAHLLIDLRT